MGVETKLGNHKGSATMLDINWLAGVTSKMNLRNPLLTGKEVRKKRLYPVLETQGTSQQNFKTVTA